MRRRIAIELGVVFALFLIAGYIWFHPASREVLAGNSSVMIGDGTDSTTIPWQYQLVVDTFRHSPARLLFGGIYTDQVAAPEGYAVFVPFSERALVLALAPFMRVDLMPTTVVWLYMVASALAMHVCGRLLGWPRTIAFALALAWAICPFTRARSVVHNGFVGVYFAPLAVAGIRLVAGSPRRLAWTARTDVLIAAFFFFCTACAAHYYCLMLIGFAPAFIVLYALFLPRGASRIRAATRLVVAALPGIMLLLWTRVLPASPSDARRFEEATPPAETLRIERENYLRGYGARASHYVSGDVRFGERDLLPWRSKITREVRRAFPDNLHESANGIRWTVLAASCGLLVVIASKRLRRHLRVEERRLGGFALAFAAVAFLTSLSPQGVRYYDVDLGPIRFFAWLFPPFRVPNRVGIFVHFATLLATGVVFSALAARAKRPWGPPAVGGALLALVVVEYLPLHPVMTSPVPLVRTALVPPTNECGAGIMVPYATYGFQDGRYYAAMSELRGTSCKLLHGGYLAAHEPALRSALSTGTFTDQDRAAAVDFARCTRASWAVFSAETPSAYRDAFCADLRWSFVSPDACRGASATASPPRPTSECAPPPR